MLPYLSCGYTYVHFLKKTVVKENVKLINYDVIEHAIGVDFDLNGAGSDFISGNLYIGYIDQFRFEINLRAQNNNNFTNLSRKIFRNKTKFNEKKNLQYLHIEFGKNNITIKRADYGIIDHIDSIKKLEKIIITFNLCLKFVLPKFTIFKIIDHFLEPDF